MKLNIQIIKKMIKINKQRYFDVFSKYSKASWDVLGCPGVIRLTNRTIVPTIVTKVRSEHQW